jgi:hypothetical protein
MPEHTASLCMTVKFVYSALYCPHQLMLVNGGQREKHLVRFEVHMALILKTIVFWDMTPCNLVDTQNSLMSFGFL